MNKKIDKRTIILLGVILLLFCTGLFAGENKQYNFDEESEFSNKGSGKNIVITTGGDVKMDELGTSDPSWSESSETLYEVQSQHKALVYKNKAYILGGYSGSSSYSKKIQYWSLAVNGAFTGSRVNNTAELEVKGGFAAVANNGYLYTMGGSAINDITLPLTPIAEVWRAPIDSNGTVGNFVDMNVPPYTSPLPYALKDAEAFVYKNTIYIYGGVINAAGTSINTKILSRTINVDGSLSVGDWTQTTIATDIQKKNAAVAVNGRYLLIVGGYKNGASVKTVHVVDMEDFSNSVANPTILTDIPEERENAVVIIEKGRIYVIGGEKDGTVKNTVYSARLSDNGTLSAWETSGTSYPSNIMDHAAVSYKGYIYSFGGHNGTSYTNSIQVGNVTGITEGTTPFSTSGVSVLPSAKYGHSVVTTGNYVYVIGGNAAGNYSNKIHMATQNASTGALSQWQESSLTLPLGMAYFASVINGDKLYVLGGYDEYENWVTGNLMTTINATDGSLASTWTVCEPYTTGRRYHSAVVTKNKVYVTGGELTGQDEPCGEVLVGDIGAGGVIGSWTATKSITAVQQHKAVIVDKYLLVIGGLYENGERTEILSIELGSNGEMVDNWSNSAVPDLSTAMRDFTAVVKDEYVYVIGGYNGTDELNSVSYTKKEQIGFNSWQTNPNLAAARTKLDAGILGNYLYVIGGADTNGDAQTTVYKASLSAGTQYSAEGSYWSDTVDLGSVVTVNSLNWNRSGDGGIQLAYNISAENSWDGYTAFDLTSPISINKSGRYLQFTAIVTSNQTSTPALKKVWFDYTAPYVLINATDVAPVKVTQNTRIIMAALDMKTDARSALWNSLAVDITGYSNLDTVHILDSSRSSIASAAVGGGNVSITIEGGLTVNTTLQEFYLAVDVKTTAVSGNSCYISFDENDFSVQSPMVPSFNNGAQFNANSNSPVISTYIPVLQLSFTTRAAGNSPREADTDQLISTMELSTDLHDISWGTLYLTLDGPDITNDINKIYLYKENSPGSEYSNEDDDLLGSVESSGIANTVTVNFASQTINESSGTYPYYLVVDIDTGANAGNTFNISITAPESFAVTASSLGIPASVNATLLPYTAPAVGSFYTLLEYPADVTINLGTDYTSHYGESPLLLESVVQNEYYNILRFTAQTDQNDSRIDTIAIEVSGTCSTSDMDDIAIWVDGPVHGYDRLWAPTNDIKQDLESITYHGNVISLNITDTGTVIGQGETTFFIVAHIDSIASTDHKLQISIPYGGITGPDRWAEGNYSEGWEPWPPAGGYPAVPDAVTISATSGDEMYWTTSELEAAADVRQSDVLQLFSFSVSVNTNAVALRQIDFPVGGPDPDNDVAAVSLYYDEIPPLFIASANVDGGVSSIEINNYKVVTSGATFIVKAEVAYDGSVGNTFNVFLPRNAGSVALKQNIGDDNQDTVQSTATITSNVYTIKKALAEVQVSNKNYDLQTLEHVEKNTEYLFQKYGLRTISHTAFWSGMYVTITGNSLVPADVEKVTVYKGNTENTSIIGTQDFTIHYGVTVNFTSTATLNTSAEDFYIALTIADGATDYHTVGTIISANRFILDSDSSLYSSYADAHSSRPTIDPKPSTLNVASQTIIPDGLVQGSSDIEVLMLSMKMNAGEAHWTSITVNNTGSGNPTRNISSIRIYKDTGNVSFNAAQDTLISTAVSYNTQGIVNIPLASSEYIATTTQNYFIVYDISAFADFGVTHGIQITSPDDISLEDVRDSIDGSFPIYNDKALTINVAQIEVFTVITDYTNLDNPDSLFDLDSNHNVIARIQMRASQKYTYWTTVNIELGGDVANAPPYTEQIKKLWIYDDDVLPSGQYNAPNERQIIGGTFSGLSPVLTINFTTKNDDNKIEATVTKNYFVIMEIAETATPNNSLWIKFNNFYFQDPDVVSANLPVTTSAAYINSSEVTIAYDDTKLLPPAPWNVDPGHVKDYMYVKLKTDVGDADWEGITLNQIGDAIDESVAEVLIYKDDGSGIFSNVGQDELIASKSVFSSSVARVDLDQPQTITTSYSCYWIAVRVTDNITKAIPGDYIRLSATTSNYRFSKSARATGAPFETDPTNGKINEPPATLVISDVSTPSIGLKEQGVENIMLMNFDLSSTPDYQIEIDLLEIDVKKISAENSDITQLKLYRENTGDSSWSVADELLGTNNITSEKVEITIPSGLIVTGSAKKLYLLADINDYAIVGSTFTFAISSGNNFDISEGDIKPTQNLPITANELYVSATNDTLKVITYDTEDTTVTQDSRNNVVKQIDLIASTNAVTLEKLAVLFEGDSLPENVDAVSLYQETNTNGQWDTGDTFISSTNIASVVTFDFTAGPIQISDTTTISYYVLCDINRYAVPTHSFRLKLQNSRIILEGPPNADDEVMALDYTSPTVNILESVDVMQITLTDYTTDQGYEYHQSEKGTSIFKFSISMDQHEAYWTSINVNISGDANKYNSYNRREVENVYIYKDETGSGTVGSYDEEDTLVGSVELATNSQNATIIFLTTQNITTTAQTYFYIIDMDSNAETGEDLSFSLSGSDFGIVLPDVVSIEAHSTDPRVISLISGSLVVQTVQSEAPDRVSQASTANSFEKIFLKSNHETIVAELTSLKVYLDGSAINSAVNGVHIFRDNRASGNIGNLDLEYDTRITTGSIKFTTKTAGRIAEIALISNESIDVTGNWYFITLDINTSANIQDNLRVYTKGSTDYGVGGGASSATGEGVIWSSAFSTIYYPFSEVIGEFKTINRDLKQGDAGVAAILALATNGSQAPFTGLKLHKTGTVSDSDIDEVWIYKDVNGNKLRDDEDIRLRDQIGHFVDGSLDLFLTTETQYLNRTTYNIMVYIQLNEDIAKDTTLGFYLEQNDLFGLGSNDTFSDIDESFPLSSPAITVNPSYDQLKVEMTDLNTSDLIPGDDNVAVARLDLNITGNLVEISRIDLQVTGDMAVSTSQYISKVNVFRDDGSNNESQFVYGSDTLVASGSVQTSTISVLFMSNEKVRTATESYYITIDLIEIDESLKTFGLNLISANVFTLVDPVSDSVTGSFPLSTSLANLKITTDTLNITQQSVAASRNVIQDQDNFVVETLIMKTDTRFVTLEKVAFQQHGTLDTYNYIDSVKAYLDDGDLSLSTNADELVNSNPSLRFGQDKIVNIELDTAKTTIGTATKNLFIVLDIAADATNGKTIELEMISATAIPPDQIGTYTWTTHSVTVARYPTNVIASANSDISVITANITSTVNQINIRDEFVLLKLELESLYNNATLQSISLPFNADILRGNFELLRIYKESGTASGYDATDTQLYNTMADDGSTVILTINDDNDNRPEITTDKTIIYIVGDLYDSTSVNTRLGMEFQPGRDIGLNSEADILPIPSVLYLSAGIYDGKQPTEPTLNYSTFTSNTNQLSFSVESSAQGGITKIQYNVIVVDPDGQESSLYDDWVSIVIQSSKLTPAIVPYTTASNNVTVSVNMMPGYGYIIKSRSQSAEGVWSPISSSQRIEVDLSPPSVPSAITAINSGADYIIINWGESSDSQSGIDRYELQKKSGINPVWETIYNSSQTSYLVTPTANFDTYYFKVRAVNNAGSSSSYSAATAGLTFVIQSPAELLSSVANYPNPFNPNKESTTITYTLNTNASVTIKIYNLFGSFVRSFTYTSGAEGGSEGVNEISWDGTDTNGNRVAMGGYLCVVEAESDDDTKKEVRKIAVIK
ncbi:FlgD immunoglobulin-like domain containing protein [Candidatus Margulisiibacteriota bacterium]